MAQVVLVTYYCARNDRRVDDDYIDYHSGRGNVIDKPALEWLGRQEPKRLWVSISTLYTNEKYPSIR